LESLEAAVVIASLARAGSVMTPVGPELPAEAVTTIPFSAQVFTLLRVGECVLAVLRLILTILMP